MADEASAPRPKRRLITRRGLLRASGMTALLTAGTAAYGFVVEPMWRLVVTSYRFTPRSWPASFKLRIAVIADVHAGEPYMSVDRIVQIVSTTNGLKPDVILMLGDYTTGHRWQTRMVPAKEWADALSALRAPLGVHSVLGNHDWWDDRSAQRAGKGPTISRIELERVGIPVYENDVARVGTGDRSFWIAGLGDQIAFFAGRKNGRRRFRGIDDLDGTLAKINDDRPIILLAHEPDVFQRVPKRVALTLSGHTHGGQVRLLGYSPIVPSKYGNRYAYGHIVEDDRHLVISGGLGCSIVPVRIGVPPEIVLIELGA